MSNCGMIVVVWSPSTGVVFNSFVASNLNLMLGNIPVRSSWLWYTHASGITWYNYVTHFVCKLLVDRNPFLVGSSTSPARQIPSMLFEARRITTLSQRRIWRAPEKHFPQQCASKAPQARMLHENPCNPFQLMMRVDGDGITCEGKTDVCLVMNQAKSGL